MKLLIATDLSPESPVLKAVLERPWPAKTTASLVHVVDVPLSTDAGQLIEVATKSAESALQSLTQQLSQSGITKTDTIVLLGNPRYAIVAQAKKWGADLVVVGSHGRSAVRRFLLGSVAQSVLRSAPCSVEIVRSKADPPSNSGMRILLATDGSDCAATAIESVATRPWPPKSSIRLVSVVPQYISMPHTVPSYWDAQITAEQAKRLEDHGRARSREAIAKARNTLSEFGVKQVEAEIPLGDPKLAILDEAEAWKTDLIVLGSHGYHGINRLLLGSVSESVAVHAHCSVEVIR